MFGVLIEKGPCDWQVFQQENGQAEVEVCGRYIIPPGVEMTKPVVYVRVMQEDSGREVLAWQPAKILENQKWQLTLTIPAGGLYRLESCLADSTNEVLEWATRGDMRSSGLVYFYLKYRLAAEKRLQTKADVSDRLIPSW